MCPISRHPFRITATNCCNNQLNLASGVLNIIVNSLAFALETDLLYCLALRLVIKRTFLADSDKFCFPRLSSNLRRRWEEFPLKAWAIYLLLLLWWLVWQIIDREVERSEPSRYADTIWDRHVTVAVVTRTVYLISNSVCIEQSVPNENSVLNKRSCRIRISILMFQVTHKLWVQIVFRFLD